MILAQNQRRIFSVLATILIAVTVFFGFNIQPVKADDGCYMVMKDGTTKRIDCNDSDDSWIIKIRDEVITTAVVGITGVGTCYALDMAASTVFPPAMALAPLCSMMGFSAGAVTGAGVVTGASAIVGAEKIGEQVIKGLAY